MINTRNWIEYFVFTLLLGLAALNVSSQSLLYKVTGEAIKHPVYIFGTIHALPQNDFFMDDRVTATLSEVERIVLEIDMTNPNMMSQVQASMMMKGKTIDKLLSVEQFGQLKKFFKDSLQIPLDYLTSVKPMMLASMMLPKIVGGPMASYEAFFVQQATKLGKPMGGLESVAEQMGYMDKIPLDKQVNILMESVNDFANSKKEFKSLVEVYKTRDVEKVYHLMMETSEEYKEFGVYLIDERNRNWIPRIIERGNTQPTFIAVGCGHLGGSNGVLNLLKEQGLTVEVVE